MNLDASKRKAMRTRSVAAPLLILAVAALVWADFQLDRGRGRLAAAVVGLLALVGIWEYVAMVRAARRPLAGGWLLGTVALLHLSPLIFTPFWQVIDRELYAPVILTMGLLLPLIGQALSPRGMEEGLERAGATLLGLILFSWPLYLAQGLCLRCLPWMVWLVIVTKGGDVGAYLVGTFWGRHRLIPHVSPGKSVEGALGGLALSGLLGWACAGIVPSGPDLLPLPVWPLLGIIVGMLAQLSDLTESLVKRLCGAKDSSRLLPVHGGVLDLTDSLMLSVPPLFLFVTLMVQEGRGV